MGKKLLGIQKIYWKDIRETIKKINPTFFKIVDEIVPPFPLFLANYAFGAEFIRKGKLYLPTISKDLISLSDDTVPSEIKQELGYNMGSNPVSMILGHTAELFLNVDKDMVPFSFGIMEPGKIFGITRILSPQISHQPVFLWNMTAGARNLFMLPKIADAAAYKKLCKEFPCPIEPPKKLSDHWKIFREIANHPNFGDPWSMDILFFSKDWFSHLRDPAFVHFHRYLLQSGWETTEFWRNRFIWDLVFSVIHENRCIKPNPYIADTVKHILAASVGAIPSFAPAVDDTAGPIQRLQYVFINYYHLSSYLPIILQPKFFDLYGENCPIYYSLQYPHTFEFSPKSRKNSSVLSDLYDIKSLMDKYISDINNGQLNIAQTPLADIPKYAKFDYFHSDLSPYKGIRSSKEIPNEDELFRKILVDELDPATAFPTNSSFARGCIRISHIPTQ